MSLVASTYAVPDRTIGCGVMSEFEQQLIDAAQRHLSADLQPGFLNLPRDAQLDVAITLLSCAGELPSTLSPAHLDALRAAVARAVSSLPNPADVRS